ncbi:mechanosensitive ion channel family protein [Robertkochia sediminum]|uniref:mechanosensitive ion channel family protein n=1 Tax=Robertkochia sediminum TaxID=2785326 RepID=UPI0019342802|nr:mechanosensitive ion channel domain-containing protein [Robertkochia sediminum]MBL7471253.1 mechanosensitive ion channel [Robertkochia sediminum]
MMKLRLNSLMCRWVSLVVFLACCPLSHAQVLDEIESQLLNEQSVDTTLKVIPFNDVLIAAGEARVRAVKLSESLVSTETIAAETKANDSVLAMVKAALDRVKLMDLEQKDQRFLSNEKINWQSAYGHVDTQKKRLSERIRSLQEKQVGLEKEIQLWRATSSFRDSLNSYESLQPVIGRTVNMLDSLRGQMELRSNLLIDPLNKNIETGVEVELLLDRIDQALMDKSAQVYSKTTPPLFLPESFSESDSGFMTNVKRSFRSEWNALKFHYNGNKSTYRLYMIFVIGVLLFFIWLSKRVRRLKPDNLEYYQRTLKAILQRPISAGVLFSIFFAAVFFPDQPTLFNDITILLILLPVIDITLYLTRGKDHTLLYILAGLMVIFLLSHLVPVNNILYRYILLGLGVIEFFVLYRLYKNRDALHLMSPSLTRFIRFLVVFHLVVVCIGIVANLLGYMSLSQIALESLLNSALLGAVLFFFTVILIGALQLFIESPYAEKLLVIKTHEAYLKDLVVRITIFGLTIFWIDAILRIFYVQSLVYDAISNFLTKEYAIGSMKFSLFKLLLFVFIIWLSVMVSRIIKVLLQEDVLSRLKLKRGVPRMIMAIAQFGAITLGILFAVRAIGMPLDQLTIIFSAFSVGIGFGLQNIFNNLVSGIILLFERPIQIGDAVEVGTLTGTMRSMGIRSSIVQTFDGAEVIVPNGQLISQEVVNWTHTDKNRRIEIIAGVAYGSDAHLVQKLLLECITSHPEAKKHPKPLVFFNDMGDSSLLFRMLFWTDNFDDWVRIRSEVIFKIYDTLNEHGIEIPFPQRDLHLRSVDPLIFRTAQEQKGPENN